MLVKRLTVVVLFALLVSGIGWTEDEQVFDGSYSWNNGGDDELQATFSSTGEGTWEVEFRFRFSGKWRTWGGTAQGKLDEGPLDGRVEANGRTWVFRGTTEDGVYRGKHWEIRGDRESPSGTLTFRR